MTTADQCHKTLNWQSIDLDTSAVETLYDQWAASYDSDMETQFSYSTPQRMSDILVRYLRPAARVLDVGAGTGQVGEMLAQSGFDNLVGIDISAGMLAVARQKNIYRDLQQETVGQPLNLPSDAFDAAVSVGTFGPTHAPASGFDELLRVVKTGGLIAFAMRRDEVADDNPFGQKFAALTAAGRWHLLECCGPFRGLPRGKPEVNFCAWVFRVR